MPSGGPSTCQKHITSVLGSVTDMSQSVLNSPKIFFINTVSLNWPCIFFCTLVSLLHCTQWSSLFRSTAITSSMTPENTTHWPMVQIFHGLQVQIIKTSLLSICNCSSLLTSLHIYFCTNISYIFFFTTFMHVFCRLILSLFPGIFCNIEWYADCTASIHYCFLHCPSLKVLGFISIQPAFLSFSNVPFSFQGSPFQSPHSLHAPLLLRSLPFPLMVLNFISL